METLRVFFAIDLPDSVKIIINNNIISPLQKKNNQPEVRWTRLEHLHITLHFLPAIKINEIPELIQNVQERIKTIPSFEIAFGELEWFPSNENPKILSLQIKEIALHDIVKKIGEGILATNYPIETRPFRAHLTLARFKNNIRSLFLQNIVLPIISPTIISHIILFESKQGTYGTHYIPLSKLNLIHH